ncbi:class I SAM-dependent methyltransferase [Lactobacillus selangorensis]|nr:class I SAM-dependent methyltransferase [Lactobacillus selangorensis]
MAEDKVETFFKQMDESTELLQRSLRSSYLDALIENGNNLVQHRVQVEDGLPDAADQAKLQTIYAQMDLAGLSNDQIRQAFQLSVLKGMRDLKVEANKQMTPDTLGYLMAFLVETLTTLHNGDALLDVAVGTGNLLTTVENQLRQNLKLDIKGYGIDNDEDLLELASISSALQHLPVELFHQDAIDPLVVSKAAVAISDLPVGYYPLDKRVQKYQTKADKGHSFAHHLLIEQSMRYLTEDGFGFFLVPSKLFDSEQAQIFMQWMKDNVYLQGFLNLPKSLFHSEETQKAILILQKKGPQAKQVKEVLLGEFPDFTDQKAFARYTAEIRQWKAQNLN